LVGLTRFISSRIRPRDSRKVVVRVRLKVHQFNPWSYRSWFSSG